MTAAHRLKGMGWFAVVVAVALGLYLVSLRVAAERKRLDDVNGRIAFAERDIRALETEFDTRANLAQLERWNGDTLALAAPTAAQFVSDDAALAALDPNNGAVVRTAALVVPTGAPAPLPTVAPPLAPTPAVVPVQPIEAPRATVVAVAAPSRPTFIPAAQVVAPTGRAAPAIARAAESARAAVAVARVRPQAVALLDRKLLSDTTFGDIMTGARAEARR